MQNRPQSLAEIAALTGGLSEFGLHLRDFLRTWNLAIKTEPDAGGRIQTEPRVLAGTFAQAEVCDAFFAALGKHLAEEAGISAPDWVENPRRQLAEPWFALDSPPARQWLKQAALPSFRDRNLFVDASALARL